MRLFYVIICILVTGCGTDIDTRCPYPDGVRIFYGEDVPEPEAIAQTLRVLIAQAGFNIRVTMEVVQGVQYLQEMEWVQHGQASTVYVSRDADAADWWTGLYIGGGVSLLDWTGRPDTYLRALTILHELGHSAGANHNDVLGDIMRTGRVWFIPEDEQKMRECFEQ